MTMTEEMGIKRTNGKAFCEACGNDLTVNGSVRHVAHLDGAKFYTDHYECTNAVRECPKRTKESGCGENERI